MLVVGVDGCRGGWCAVSLSKDKCIVDVYPDFNAVWEKYHEASSILVDIPIGLPHSGIKTRRCDEEARGILGKRTSSVFPVPSRDAIYLKGNTLKDWNLKRYREACEANQASLGKKISKQAWNISKKIREVDEVLLGDCEARKVVREIHPEVCFWALNNKKPMVHNKKTEEGANERLAVLRQFIPDSDFLVIHSLKVIVGAGGDDIIDAFAAAVTARQCANTDTWRTIPEEAEKDKKGLPMEMVFFFTRP